MPWRRFKQRLDENPQAVRQRRETIEHPIGPVKIEHGKIRTDTTHLMMRWLKNVRTEMALSVLAYSLTSVVNILGVALLLNAIRT